MPDEVLERLLRGNDGHVEAEQRSAPPPHVPATAIRVGCTMHAGSHRPWPLDGDDAVIDCDVLGPVTWRRRDGHRVPDPRLSALVHRPTIASVVLVGHTDCDVVADVHDRCGGASGDLGGGASERLAPLRAVVAEALEDGSPVVADDGPADDGTRIARLVEQNVARQVAFLDGRLVDDVTVAGYVHDEHGAYPSVADDLHLVALDGERGVDALRSRLPDGASVSVASCLR